MVVIYMIGPRIVNDMLQGCLRSCKNDAIRQRRLREVEVQRVLNIKRQLRQQAIRHTRDMDELHRAIDDLRCELRNRRAAERVRIAHPTGGFNFGRNTNTWNNNNNNMFGTRPFNFGRNTNTWNNNNNNMFCAPATNAFGGAPATNPFSGAPATSAFGSAPANSFGGGAF